MEPYSNKYLSLFSLKTIIAFVLSIAGCSDIQAQNGPVNKNNISLHFNPLFVSSFKKPVKANPTLNERYKRPNNQLMYWPNYPLTAAQIAERDKKYDQPIGKQIANEIVDSYINSIINGKPKKPVTTAPKF